MNSFNIDYFKGLKSSWDFLKETKLPIFIYGMGNGADKILSQFLRLKISYCGLFASDEFVRGHSFAGHRVHTIKEIEDNVGEFVVVLAFAAGYASIIDKIKDIASRHIVIAPDVPVVGEGLFTMKYLDRNFDSFKNVYDNLADEKSKEVFTKVIEYKITGKIDPIIDCSTSPSEAVCDILNLTDAETYVDAGAYNGDTVLQFVDKTRGSYNKIIAVEPDRKNFKKLKKAVGAIPAVEVINSAVWSEDKLMGFSEDAGRQSAFSPDAANQIQARSIDSILNGDKASYIKYDVEGAEKQAILGSKSTISSFSPKLSIAIYHRIEDMFELPLLIKEINPSYKIYMRKYPYIPAWEVNLLCVPNS